ncbi:hypothetical protein CRD60_03355 [Bifidobacterium aemilianum]|uniref:Uncharacterized protein n=1 Tax=Bifidobacterium aemilianum TaxID=2493120 RepID=A0A366K8X1_9BIFI|nr:hypothetical protein [Bifidobacterium aemilianum]RBP98190.1 hypothetical protein CRD60_03355 [Bifidobacterium aemilianum]
MAGLRTRLVEEILSNWTTLVFVDARVLSEKLTATLNDLYGKMMQQEASSDQTSGEAEEGQYGGWQAAL